MGSVKSAIGHASDGHASEPPADFELSLEPIRLIDLGLLPVNYGRTWVRRFREGGYVVPEAMRMFATNEFLPIRNSGQALVRLKLLVASQRVIYFGHLAAALRCHSARLLDFTEADGYREHAFTWRRITRRYDVAAVMGCWPCHGDAIATQVEFPREGGVPFFRAQRLDRPWHSDGLVFRWAFLVVDPAASMAC